MPIYEYQCRTCNKQLEVLRKISDAPLVKCPACGEDSLRKKVSASAFRLKGDGWYETDFKTSGKKNLASGSSDSAAAGSSDKPGDKSTDKSGDKSGDKSSVGSSDSKSTT